MSRRAECKNGNSAIDSFLAECKNVSPLQGRET